MPLVVALPVLVAVTDDVAVEETSKDRVGLFVVVAVPLFVPVAVELGVGTNVMVADAVTEPIEEGVPLDVAEILG